MGSVAIITDSTVCLPRDVTEGLDVEIVPLRFLHEDRVYVDGIDITPDEMYRILPGAKNLPTTSAPAPGDYYQALEKAAGRHSSILVITISAKFSTMFDSARTAVEMMMEQGRGATIEVLDCGTAAGAQGLVVLAAARAASAGEDLVNVTEAARSVMAKTGLVAFVDTLYYLVKGGRVPKAVGWANTLIKIKPIFQIRPLSGEANVTKIARTRAEAVEQLLVIVKKAAKGRAIHAMVMHSSALSEAEELKGRLASELRCDEIYVSDFTPAMGIHSGPGVLGIAFYSDG